MPATGGSMQLERIRVLALSARLRAGIAIALLAVLGGAAWTAQETPIYTVSQKGRQFHPAQISMRRGETLRIVNDDGDLLHHAYVESDTFNFDSGDQLPGSRTDVTFPVSGTFNVLCGIHPKMKLVVEVK